MDTVHRLLRDLVAIDSVNPTLVAGAAGEAAIARRLVEEFEAMGVPVELQEVAPGRPNVVATLEGRAPGRSLMLCGHIDTVGVAGMTEPFDAGGARRAAAWPRLAGHEERRGGDGRRRARGGRGRRARRRSSRRRVRGRRGALEHRRRRAGDPLAGRRRRRHRTDRPRRRGGAQGVRVVGRSTRWAAPPTAAGQPRASTPSCTWAGCWPSSRRSTGRCRPGAAIRGWVRRRSTRRPSPAGAS